MNRFFRHDISVIEKKKCIGDNEGDLKHERWHPLSLLRVSNLGLTDANWEQPWPAVVLLADPYRGANEPESRVALVNHRVSVAKILPDHLAVNDLLRNTTVSSCGAVRRNKRTYNKINPFLETWHKRAIMKPSLWLAFVTPCSQNTISDPIFALLI